MNIHEIYRKVIPAKLKNKLWSWNRQVKIIFQYLPSHLKVWINYTLHNKDQFENKLIAAVVLGNEASYIQEWIEYHKLIGIEKFIVYDHESTDNIKEVLQPYIESGEVVYSYWPGDYKKIQPAAYNDAIKKYRNKAEWIAFIDVDEFIVPCSQDTILEVIDEIEKDLGKTIPGLAIHWVQYGHSGIYNKPDGLVIEHYIKHDGINPHVKSIVNPRMVVYYDIHNALFLFGIPARNEKGTAIWEGAVRTPSDTGCEKIRINHYYTKSFEDWIRKNAIYNLKPVFDPDYMSHQEEHIMDKYVPKLKSILNIKN
ncbi:hypothetical protein FACS189413_12260 [Bacteroidia bacterium]|nr:hypothetical protein FACS189413_12260 [Bacteroidia bacterium]